MAKLFLTNLRKMTCYNQTAGATEWFDVHDNNAQYYTMFPSSQ